MKKILPVVVVLIIAGVGAVFYLYKGGGQPKTEEGGVAPSTEKISESFSGTLKAAIELGVPMKCSYMVEGVEFEGYIKGEQYRGRMETAEGEVSEIIIKDNCMWSWTEGEEQGAKMCFEATEEEQSVWDRPQGASAPDIDYHCVPAVVNDAQFTPPGDIQFLDLDEMMESYGQ